MIGHQLVVVADAHLNAGSPADEEAFLAFLDEVPSLGDSLLLAGDIFDFWFTYPRVIPRDCIRVTARLIELARRTPVLMVGGNHDRWGSTFWGPQAGIIFDARQLRFDIGSRQVLAIHGDGVHREKKTSHFLNSILDMRTAIAAFSAVPPGLGFRIAKSLGHNPQYVAAHPEVIDIAAERQARWATNLLEQDPAVGVLVMGHTHRAALDQAQPGRWYLNPGAWLEGYRYALINSGGLELREFAAAR